MAQSKNTYIDIGFNFDANLVTKDMSVSINDQSIKDAVLNLLLTNKGERLYQPTTGSGIPGLLFENIDMFTAHQIKKNIEVTLSNEEPRIKIKTIEVTAVPDYNEFIVTIDFYTIYNIEKTQILQFSLTSQQA